MDTRIQGDLVRRGDPIFCNGFPAVVVEISPDETRVKILVKMPGRGEFLRDLDHNDPSLAPRRLATGW